MFVPSRRWLAYLHTFTRHSFLPLTKTGRLTAKDVVTWGVRGPSQDIYDDGTERESVYFFGIIDILQAWNTKKVCSEVGGRGYDFRPSLARTDWGTQHADARALVSLIDAQVAESFIKSKLRGKDPHGISAVNADQYATRFMDFVATRLEE